MSLRGLKLVEGSKGRRVFKGNDILDGPIPIVIPAEAGIQGYGCLFP